MEGKYAAELAMGFGKADSKSHGLKGFLSLIAAKCFLMHLKSQKE
jgi:hypothetical protein